MSAAAAAVYPSITSSVTHALSPELGDTAGAMALAAEGAKRGQWFFQLVMARAGLCSRRDAERWIAEGRVAVDGTVLTSPAVTVTAQNEVRVDGRPLPGPG